MRHSADEAPRLHCPVCDGPVRKVFHAAGIIFKGSGWYVTDSAQKTPAPADAPAKTETKPAADTPAAGAPAADASAAAAPAGE
ncbi:MAG TPA: zinc ribbon domain-containing protein [Armatimonadota bacterium]|nr:zinc ribbon domain-containing protein [Armatimonadota bacterium]